MAAELGTARVNQGRESMDTTIDSRSYITVTGGTLMVLSAETGRPIGAPVAVGAESCIVGRNRHSHVVLDDRRVSTSHCELIATDRGVLLRDLESKNGTYVNQVRLESGSSVYLSVDSRIRCGETWLEFRCAESERVPISRADSFGALVGRSVPMRRLYAQLASLRSHELSVLVTGETGTGKELVAQAIHRSSVRSGGPLVVVDCTTIPSSLAESVLFGHEKGAFTGAVSRHVSPFLAAHGGTLFFDELGELPLDIQPKLLRALETRQIQSVGSNRPVPIDVRVVAATRRNLHAEMNSKQFREDLYYRFAQVVVDVPPLRARTEDIPDLVAHFLAYAGDPGAIDRIDTPSMNRFDSTRLARKRSAATKRRAGGVRTIGRRSHRIYGRTEHASELRRASRPRLVDESLSRAQTGDARRSRARLLLQAPRGDVRQSERDVQAFGAIAFDRAGTLGAPWSPGRGRVMANFRQGWRRFAMLNMALKSLRIRGWAENLPGDLSPPCEYRPKKRMSKRKSRDARLKSLRIRGWVENLPDRRHSANFFRLNA